VGPPVLGFFFFFFFKTIMPSLHGDARELISVP